MADSRGYYKLLTSFNLSLIVIAHSYTITNFIIEENFIPAISITISI